MDIFKKIEKEHDTIQKRAFILKALGSMLMKNPLGALGAAGAASDAANMASNANKAARDAKDAARRLNTQFAKV